MSWIFQFCILLILSTICTQSVLALDAQKSSDANRPIKDKWALLIGISKFADEKINLKYASKDALDFYKYLTNEGKFAKDHVLVLTDQLATRANILSVIGDKWLPRVAHPDDLVLIYLSSHGSPADLDVGGLNYIVTYDTKIDSLYATAIPFQDLMNCIKSRVHSDRVVLILDACHSGAASTGAKGLFRSGNVDAAAVAIGTGQLVIASSKPEEVSWEGKSYDNSVFTHYIIDALRKGNNQSTLSEAFKSLKENVQNEVLRDRGKLQTPEMKSSWKGDDLVLSIAPSSPRGGIPLNTLELEPVSPALSKATVLQKAIVTHTDAAPITVLDNGNVYKVFNGPRNETSFTLDSKALLTYVFTYHWNDARGAKPGTIALRSDSGTIYGPWQTVGKLGQGNVQNAYWECEPLAELPAGRYTVLDSNKASWSQNVGTNHCGIARVKVVPRYRSPLQQEAKAKAASKLFDNGNVYLVSNNPKSQTLFKTNSALMVTQIINYHWNNGKGQTAGQITLVHQDGTVYGPYQCYGTGGQGGAVNVYWKCDVKALLKPGVYKVLDSDKKTWSQNSQSGYAGFTQVFGTIEN